MRRCLVALAIVVLCLAPLRADLTFTQTTTVEGGIAATMGDSNKPMTTVTRIKGKKARTDIEVMDVKMSTLTDLATKEITVLNHVEKTARPLSETSPMLPPGTPMPKIDVTFKPTGQSKAIDGNACDEHTFTISINMAEMGGGQQMPPEAAEMLKDVRLVMNGSTWIAKSGPAVPEYIAFQKGAADANMAAALGGFFGGGKNPQMEKMMAAMSSAPGLPYLTELTMSVEGSGPLVEMMKKQSGMKMIQKISSVSTEPVADDLFTVPADYKVVKP